MRSLRPAAVISAVLTAALFAAPDRRADAQEAGAGTTAPAAWQYPREVRAAGLRVALHEPTVLSYTDADGTVALRIPLEITDAAGRVSFGAAHATGAAHLDLGSRLFLVDGLAVGECPLPGLDAAIAPKLQADLGGALAEPLLLRLELLTDRPGAAPPVDEEGGPKISTRAPEIHVRRTPAVLVQIEGDPELVPVDTFPLQYVANSATDIFHDPSTKRWFMLLHEHWVSSSSVDGPWAWHDDKLPVVLTQLPVSSPRGHVWSFVPGTRRYTKRTEGGEPPRPDPMPEIIVSHKPAELVLLLGDPLFTLIPHVKLMTVANTISDLFFHPRSGKYYLLISGRWFVAEDVDGKWEPAFGSLPEEFAQIPREHARGHVRWCVAGTPEAAEAAARAALPERALLSRRVSASVRYEGKDIRTAPLEGTEVRHVTNTEDDVLVVGGVYYACVRGAWFRSKNGESPWDHVESLPDDLLPVPESTGFWHVNVCSALGAEDKAYRFQIRGPYRGIYVHRGAPVYGNGWDRRGLLRSGNWYPAARTYGENRWYDPVAGAFQPRNVLYDAQGPARATKWSPYTASYGRVRWYADRYLQGGRRMFPYDDGQDLFDLDASRPDVYGIWTDDVLARDGLPAARFPLGDRSAETTRDVPPVVSDSAGTAFRLSGGKVERWADGQWRAAADVSDDVRARLAAHERTRTLPDALRRWAEKRSGALPVNPVVTPR